MKKNYISPELNMLVATVREAYCVDAEDIEEDIFSLGDFGPDMEEAF